MLSPGNSFLFKQVKLDENMFSNNTILIMTDEFQWKYLMNHKTEIQDLTDNRSTASLQTAFYKYNFIHV